MAQLRHGSDTVGSALSYVLGKNLENLTLTGSGDLDRTGNELTGKAGSNLLDGKAGADALAGGAGDDALVFSDGDGADTMEGLEALSDDEVIDVSDFGFPDFSEPSANFRQNGLDTETQLDEDDMVAFVEANRADLQGGDFVI